MKKLAVFAALTLFCSLLLVTGPVRSQGNKGKLLKKANKIQNSYIVVLDDSVVGEKGEYSIAPYMATDMANIYRAHA